MSEDKNKEVSGGKSNKVLTVIGSILCVILVPILIINCTMLVKSWMNKDEVPSVFSYSPLIVLSMSMEPTIMGGDMIIIQHAEPEEVKVGDIISFFDPQSAGSAIVTHRVIEILENEDGTISFRTLGDNNLGVADEEPCPGKNLVGEYKARIPFAGKVAMFMQTTPGLLVCILVPLALFVGYDVIRRKKYDKKKNADTEALMAELEALRAAKAAQTEKSEESGAEPSKDEPDQK